MNLNSFQPKESTETMESLPFAMNERRKSNVLATQQTWVLGESKTSTLTGRLDKLKV
jgi:hypothetical protein